MRIRDILISSPVSRALFRLSRLQTERFVKKFPNMGIKLIASNMIY